jgi:hypothetical protein
MATTTNTPATTTNCLRCGRTLKATASVARGYGPTCKAKVTAAAQAAAKAKYAHKPHLVAKAEEAIEAGGVTVLRGKVCRVTGSQEKGREGRIYLAHPAACNCAAGLRGKHLCHHRIVADILTATYTAA